MLTRDALNHPQVTTTTTTTKRLKLTAVRGTSRESRPLKSKESVKIPTTLKTEIKELLIDYEGDNDFDTFKKHANAIKNKLKRLRVSAFVFMTLICPDENSRHVKYIRNVRSREEYLQWTVDHIEEYFTKCIQTESSIYREDSELIIDILKTISYEHLSVLMEKPIIKDFLYNRYSYEFTSFLNQYLPIEEILAQYFPGELSEQLKTKTISCYGNVTFLDILSQHSIMLMFDYWKLGFRPYCQPKFNELLFSESERYFYSDDPGWVAIYQDIISDERYKDLYFFPGETTPWELFLYNSSINPALFQQFIEKTASKPNLQGIKNHINRPEFREGSYSKYSKIHNQSFIVQKIIYCISQLTEPLNTATSPVDVYKLVHFLPTQLGAPISEQISAPWLKHYQIANTTEADALFLYLSTLIFDGELYDQLIPLWDVLNAKKGEPKQLFKSCLLAFFLPIHTHNYYDLREQSESPIKIKQVLTHVATQLNATELSQAVELFIGFPYDALTHLANSQPLTTLPNSTLYDFARLCSDLINVIPEQTLLSSQSYYPISRIFYSALNKIDNISRHNIQELFSYLIFLKPTSSIRQTEYLGIVLSQILMHYAAAPKSKSICPLIDEFTNEAPRWLNHITQEVEVEGHTHNLFSSYSKHFSSPEFAQDAAEILVHLLEKIGNDKHIILPKQFLEEIKEWYSNLYKQTHLDTATQGLLTRIYHHCFPETQTTLAFKHAENSAFDATADSYSPDLHDIEAISSIHPLLELDELKPNPSISMFPQHPTAPLPQEESRWVVPALLLQESMDDFVDQLFAENTEEAGMQPVSATTVNEQSAMQVDEPVFSGSLTIRAGIQDKYLGGALPSLALEKPATQTQLHTTFSVSFQPLTSLHPKSQLKHTQTIDALGLQADLYTAEQQRITPETKVTFICAGRKGNALVPGIPPGERVVLVLTENEFKELGHLPAYDALVVKELRSAGRSLPTGTITSRRLAIILFAAYSDLATILILDDNIREVNYSAFWTDYSLFDFLCDKQSEALCVSINTGFNKKLKSGQLGSKLFMLHLAKIREYLVDEQLYSLLPNPEHNQYWGEDYYLQIMLHHLAQPLLKGYAIVSPQEAYLLRSSRHHNAFRATNRLAAPLQPLSEEYAQSLSEMQLDLVTKTITRFNNIIMSNQERYQAQQQRLAHADLLHYHARLNHMEMDAPFFDIHLPEHAYSFQQRWQQVHEKAPFDARYLRGYQQQAITAALTMNSPQGQLMMATGTGKTRVQIELARLAYHAALDNECIIIVTPFIQLVEQFYDSFVAYNKQSSSAAFNMQVPQESIIKVSSALRSCSVAHLLYNQRIEQQKCILIFCEQSFHVLMDENPEFVSRCCLLLLDEYHQYAQQVPELIRKLKQLESELLLIGSTATPPRQHALPALFNYTFKQGINDGILAPVIADSLGLTYSKNNLDNLIGGLPQLLRQIVHPGFQQKTTLAQGRGVIYFSSINECKQAKELLEKERYTVYEIHSGNSHYKQELKDFIDGGQPGVLLAVNMLGIGFDDPSLSWLMLAVEHQQDNILRLEQMVGRVVRSYRDKIGYILGFEHTVQKIVTSLLQDITIDATKIQPEYYNQKIQLTSSDHFTTKAHPASQAKKRKLSTTLLLQGLHSPKLPCLPEQGRLPRSPILIDEFDEPQQISSSTNTECLVYPTIQPSNNDRAQSSTVTLHFGGKHPRYLSLFRPNYVEHEQSDSAKKYAPC